MRSRPRFERKPERPLKRLFFPIRQRQRGLGRSPCRDARRSSRRGVKSESCRPQPRWLDPPMIGKQVFFDPTGERALVLRWLAWVAGTLSALVVVVFVAILMIVHRPINDSFDDRLLGTPRSAAPGRRPAPRAMGLRSRMRRIRNCSDPPLVSRRNCGSKSAPSKPAIPRQRCWTAIRFQRRSGVRTNAP